MILRKPIHTDNRHIKLVKGENGAVFIPHVDEQFNLSWTNDGGLPNPPVVNLKGEKPVIQATVTLAASGWASRKQTVTVNGVTATNVVVVTTDNIDNGIECTAQGTNSLTFTCDSVPSSAVTVSVTIF